MGFDFLLLRLDVFRKRPAASQLGYVAGSVYFRDAGDVQLRFKIIRSAGFLGGNADLIDGPEVSRGG